MMTQVTASYSSYHLLNTVSDFHLLNTVCDYGTVFLPRMRTLVAVIIYVKYWMKPFSNGDATRRYHYT